MHVLEQVQRQRARPVEQQRVALLKVVEIAVGDVLDQPLQRGALMGRDQPLGVERRRELGEDAYDLRGSCGFTFGNGCSGGSSETNLFGTPKTKRAKTPMEVA